MARLFALLCALALAGSACAGRPASEASGLVVAAGGRDLTWSLFSKAPSNSPEAIAEEEHQRARDKLVTVRSAHRRPHASERARLRPHAVFCVFCARGHTIDPRPELHRDCLSSSSCTQFYFAGMTMPKPASTRP